MARSTAVLVLHLKAAHMISHPTNGPGINNCPRIKSDVKEIL
jgi:hypothetical protein